MCRVVVVESILNRITSLQSRSNTWVLVCFLEEEKGLLEKNNPVQRIIVEVLATI